MTNFLHFLRILEQCVPKMLLSFDAGDCGVEDLVVLVDNDDTLGL